jgi:hypothetical protein
LDRPRAQRATRATGSVFRRCIMAKVLNLIQRDALKASFEALGVWKVEFVSGSVNITPAYLPGDEMPETDSYLSDGVPVVMRHGADPQEGRKAFNVEGATYFVHRLDRWVKISTTVDYFVLRQAMEELEVKAA